MDSITKLSEGTEIKRQLLALDPDTFLEDMVRTGQLSGIKPDYASNVFMMCNISCQWAISRLRMNGLLEDVQVVRGEFNGRDHTWLQIEDYYVDLTLAQFKSEAPRLAVVKASDVKEEHSRVRLGYSVNEKFNHVEFMIRNMRK